MSRSRLESLSYELAFRMQLVVLELLSSPKETKATLGMYGCPITRPQNLTPPTACWRGDGLAWRLICSTGIMEALAAPQ